MLKKKGRHTIPGSGKKDIITEQPTTWAPCSCSFTLPPEVRACVGVRCLEWAPRMLLTQWACMKAEEAKLMKLYSYKGVQTICPTFASKRETDYIYYTGQQTEVPSVLEADTAVNCEWTLLRPFTIKSWEVSLTQKVTKKKYLCLQDREKQGDHSLVWFI